ncbi:MAG: beta-ketoacyl-ACP reductase [Leptospiraceae bacterium]|nr:beta-ketoacyl-ACP reductase [Leptospiraceae bacterium]MDW7976898.1 beta-ketoacyl-ACP reductase [Leptospiraceae bacterium]
MSERLFSGKVALVTGSARGIGKAIAEDLAEWGANQVILDLRYEDCEKTANEISEKYNVRCLPIACDVTKSDQVQEAANKVKAEFGGLDFLVNNAGVIRDNLLIRMKEEEWDFVINVNLKGPFLVTKAFLPMLMKAKDGGRIINISSISGLVGQVGQANYAASKAGLIGFTKVVAREYAKKGILCNVICPGYVETDLTAVLPDAVKEELRKSIPLGRPTQVKDISRMVRFLCSDDASFITGNVIRVDGGTAIGL